MKRAIHWFRRDLRVSDNTALWHAAQRAETVLPVFILEDAFRTGPDVGAARTAFLLRSVESLRKNLAELGYPLIVRRGRSEEEIPNLCAETGAQAVFANKRYEPYATARDGRVFAALNRIGVGFELFKDAVAWEEEEILNQSGRPYTVFTPYAKAWKAKKTPKPWPRLPRAKTEFPNVPSHELPIDSAELGHPLEQTIFEAGEAAALKRFRQFVARDLKGYESRRDFPAMEGTSRMSAHLRAGTIGIRTLLAQAGDGTFLKELIWREFYLQILSNFPHVMKGCFRKEFDQLEWENSDALFTAWKQGATGYPIVDAAMRCLNATGWMHNRLRMIVAMFLTKDLLVSWQWGERYFMKQLVDGDLAANNGGWQWSAGTGTDAAPYFRIFNPVTQGKKFDPSGEFIRTWIPELAGCDEEAIHEPWKFPLLAPAYPKRIVLHEEQRGRCLRMYGRIKAA